MGANSTPPQKNIAKCLVCQTSVATSFVRRSSNLQCLAALATLPGKNGFLSLKKTYLQKNEKTCLHPDFLVGKMGANSTPPQKKCI